MPTLKRLPVFVALLIAFGTGWIAPGVVSAKETPEQVRERQAKVRERVEQSRKKEREELTERNKKAPCPLPTELEGQTADGWCAAKGYKDQFGRPAKGVNCTSPAKKADDKGWLFLWSYEHLHGCSQPGGCTVRACDVLYKHNTAYARPAE